ncbi:MAG: neutral/alkaline non-lysosomal ceramidase N-terminal domain-containing protein [Caldilineaceae bacterium]|nr:neutral/alkaline non-lysosomal ceramidase N-terminal domain-containing protein [Caldilineaceae bacterium]
MRAGVAEINITPHVGVELAGYDFGPSVGILDDLMAQALILQSGEESVIFVCADLLGLGDDLVGAVRQRVEEQWGVSGERVILSGSHTHSGPATMYVRHWGTVDKIYRQEIESKLVGLIGMAQSTMVEAQVKTAIGHVDQISENRRRGEEVIDPAVPVLRVESAEGDPLAILFNFGCHPVALHSYRNLISPDFPGYARQVVRSVLGEEVCTLFTLGAAGDVNPKGYEHGRTTPRRARQIGAILGCEVAKVALDIPPAVDTRLQVERTIVNLPLASLPPSGELGKMIQQFDLEIENRRQQGRPRWEVSEAAIRRDWAKEAMQAQKAGEQPATRPCEIQAIRLGEAAFVVMPLEVFSETALAIKAGSPFQSTCLISNANGTLGYLPPAQAYTVRDYTNPQGLAPKVLGLYAFDKGAEPLVRQEAIQLLQRLTV